MAWQTKIFMISVASDHFEQQAHLSIRKTQQGKNQAYAKTAHNNDIMLALSSDYGEVFDAPKKLNQTLLYFLAYF